MKLSISSEAISEMDSLEKKSLLAEFPFQFKTKKE